MRLALEPPPGLVSDETTYATPGLWEDGDKVRFWKGRPEAIGGWTKYHATAVTGTSRNAFQWTDLSSYLNTAIGTHSKLQVLNRGTLYDITPTSLLTGNVSTVTTRWGYGMGGYGAGPYGGGVLMETYPRTWSFGAYGEWLIANPRGRTIFIWQNDTSAVAEPLENAPGTATSIIVTPDRQIIALGAEPVSATYSSMVIRGCDIENITTWTPTSTNNAFEVTLEGGSRIVGGAMFGEYMVVWTDTSLFLGQFQTDNTLDPWRFDLVAEDCGLLTANAFAVTESAVVWLTPAYRFMSYQVGGLPQVMDCPISREFRDNVDTDQADKIVAEHVLKFNEVRWFYPDTRDGSENSRYVAVSMAGQGWSKGALVRTAVAKVVGESPILIGFDGYLYEHESGTTADGASLSWMVQSTGTYANEGESRVYVLGVWPDFEQQGGSINLTLTTQDYPQATAVSKGPWALAAGREKRDLRAEGRIIGTRWEGTGFARFGKPSFEIRPGGRR